MITLSDSAGKGNDEVEKPEEGYKAPNFKLETVQGEEIELSELEGTPVFINFWATSCPQYRNEKPAIQKIYTKISGTVNSRKRRINQ